MGATTTGTRLRCDECSTEIIVVRRPEDTIACYGKPMAFE
jgi:hypothetical protein